jgi:hypothetical protein
MEKQANLKKSILVLAVVTALILAVPLVAMQFTAEVNWSLADFIIMGMLVFGTGASFVFVMKYATNFIYRIAVLGAFGTTFLLVWANLAVGLIGSGPHAGNLMYLAVYAIVIIGSIRSRFTSVGMERVMYVAAISLVVLAAIAIFTNMGAYPGSSVNEIIAVNGFFATLFGIAGSLFRLAAQEKSTEKSAS